MASTRSGAGFSDSEIRWRSWTPPSSATASTKWPCAWRSTTGEQPRRQGQRELYVDLAIWGLRAWSDFFVPSSVWRLLRRCIEGGSMADQQRIGLDEIIPHFEALEDSRSPINLQHPLVSVVVIARLAVLAGAGGPTAVARWT